MKIRNRVSGVPRKSETGLTAKRHALYESGTLRKPALEKRTAELIKEYGRVVPEGMSLEKCICCGQIKLHTEFGIARGRPTGIQDRCFVCMSHTGINYNNIKRAANAYVSRAVRKGELVKPEVCSTPGCNCTKQIEAHHDDYAKPAEVRWLCASCHAKWHRENKLVPFCCDSVYEFQCVLNNLRMDGIVPSIISNITRKPWVMFVFVIVITKQEYARVYGRKKK